jgi:hypothetical protein
MALSVVGPEVSRPTAVFAASASLTPSLTPLPSRSRPLETPVVPVVPVVP